MMENMKYPCGRIARRTFLADCGMGFTGLALGAMLAWDTGLYIAADFAVRMTRFTISPCD